MDSSKLGPTTIAVSNSPVYSPVRLALFFIPAFAWLPSDTATFSVYLAAFGPVAAAVIVMAVSSGRAALVPWLKTIFNPRGLARLYLARAFVLPFIMGLFHNILYRLGAGRMIYRTPCPGICAFSI